MEKILSRTLEYFFNRGKYSGGRRSIPSYRIGYSVGRCSTPFYSIEYSVARHDTSAICRSTLSAVRVFPQLYFVLCRPLWYFRSCSRYSVGRESTPSCSIAYSVGRHDTCANRGSTLTADRIRQAIFMDILK